MAEETPCEWTSDLCSVLDMDFLIEPLPRQVQQNHNKQFTCLFHIDETLKDKKLKKKTNRNNNHNLFLTKYMNKFHNRFLLWYYRL